MASSRLITRRGRDLGAVGAISCGTEPASRRDSTRLNSQWLPRPPGSRWSLPELPAQPRRRTVHLEPAPELRVREVHWRLHKVLPVRTDTLTGAGHFRDFALTPDGRQLVTVSGDVSLWDLATGRHQHAVALPRLVEHTWLAACVRTTTAQILLVSDNLVAVLDARGEPLVAPVEIPWQGREDWEPLSTAFRWVTWLGEARGFLVVAHSYANELAVLRCTADGRSPRQLYFKADVAGFVSAPDGKRLFVVVHGVGLRRLDLHEEHVVESSVPLPRLPALYHTVCAADGLSLYVSTHGAILHLDAESGDVRAEYDIDCREFAVCPRGRMLLSCDFGNEIGRTRLSMHDLVRGERLWQVELASQADWCRPAFSSEGRWALAAHQGMIWVFDAGSGAVLSQPQATLGAVRGLAFAPDDWLAVLRPSALLPRVVTEWHSLRDGVRPVPAQGLDEPPPLAWQRRTPKWARNLHLGLVRDRVAVAAYSQDSRYLALGTTSGHILVYSRAER